MVDPDKLTHYYLSLHQYWEFLNAFCRLLSFLETFLLEQFFQEHLQIVKHFGYIPGLEVIKLEYKLRLKIKRKDWLLADTCPQAANHCASSQSLRFIFESVNELKFYNLEARTTVLSVLIFSQSLSGSKMFSISRPHPQ